MQERSSNDLPLNPAPIAPIKNPAAVALGRLGGLKGGLARAKKLSAKRRREIAVKAAQKRWANKKKLISKKSYGSIDTRHRHAKL